MKRMMISCTLAALLSACGSSGSNSDNATSQYAKQGIITNACGPTDAPVVRLRLTDQAIACDADVHTLPRISTYLAFTHTQDIAIGMMLEPYRSVAGDPQSASACNAGFTDCHAVGLLSIEITGQESGHFTGRYTINNDGTMTSETFKIKQCNNERPRCG